MKTKNVFFTIMLTIIFLMVSNISYASISDIEKHWCKDEIEMMYENGYIECRTGEMFEPDVSLTKAEFCMTVNKLLDYCDVDMSNQDWKEEHFAIGIEKGYMPIGSVDDTITREEACVIFERISDITIDNVLQAASYESFVDCNQVSVWAEKSVKRLVINGKIIGYTDNTLKMKNKLTRAEFVKIMSRFDKTLEKINVKDISKNISLNFNSDNSRIYLTSIDNVPNSFDVDNINFIIQKKKYYVI